MSHGARVGPNAILQTVAALEARGGRALAERVLGHAGCAGYLDAPPEEMIPEQAAAAVLRALPACLSPAEARAVARDAGARTAAYILRHRIPAPAQLVLRLLPARLAAPILMRAMAAHAWTFAGSGEVSIAPARLTIRANPLSVPGCEWHCAVFEALFRRLVGAKCAVREVSCCARGAAACVFVIETG
ncbi:bacteriochlorophyll 4-vinyl reductase [Roseovarius sp. MBR-6]|jgi:divinyl protochlorophyllide a 8-vinyl-reductase|uniref:bacteriochlorophyll 4-vinyl reductase n=1 Tax=Roseovarius sp. MBR-6 TaxID=3156459 RepID=UPI0033911D8C